MKWRRFFSSNREDPRMEAIPVTHVAYLVDLDDNHAYFRAHSGAMVAMQADRWRTELSAPMVLLLDIVGVELVGVRRP